VADLEALHGVISTTGWGITRESLQAIQAWDPGAYLVAEDPAGRALGTVFGLRWRRTAWVGHLVVRPDCRGGGVGQALFGRALERVLAIGCRPVYLTATAMGEPLYAKFGLVADGGWSRWSGTAEAGPAKGVQVMKAADLEDVVRFDAERFGDDRGAALRWLLAAYPGEGRILRRPDGSLGGYLLRGTEGLGPFVADEDAAPALFRAALGLFAGRPASFTFPDGNRLAPELCRSAGLTPGRTWLRMRLGDDLSPPRDDSVFNASVAKG
jgi:GNAT superfamily N-acetyltransferase